MYIYINIYTIYVYIYKYIYASLLLCSCIIKVALKLNNLYGFFKRIGYNNSLPDFLFLFRLLYLCFLCLALSFIFERKHLDVRMTVS